MTYYNTTNETGQELHTAKAKAQTQGEMILDYFKRCNKPLSPSQILIQFPQWPITSIRRAMTDLTSDGKLERTESMRTGLYGRNEHTWCLAGEKIECGACERVFALSSIEAHETKAGCYWICKVCRGENHERF